MLGRLSVTEIIYFFSIQNASLVEARSRFMMIKFGWWRRNGELRVEHACSNRSQQTSESWNYILKFYRSLERRLRFNPAEKGSIPLIQADLLLIFFSSFLVQLIHPFSCFRILLHVQLLLAPLRAAPQSLTSSGLLLPYHTACTLQSTSHIECVFCRVIHFSLEISLLIVYDVKSRNSAAESALLCEPISPPPLSIDPSFSLPLLIKIKHNNIQFSHSWFVDEQQSYSTLGREQSKNLLFLLVLI